MHHDELHQRSIDIIKKNQNQSGSYIASPNFDAYAYSWLRDGSFIAAAMDMVGEYRSAQAFHHWVGQIVQRYRDKIGKIQKSINTGQTLNDNDFLFTRYSLDGYEDLTDEGWGNFQYDGYGTWLWALCEHYRLTGDRKLISDVWQSVQDALAYLRVVWRLPSYDCWEEHPELLHPYSLACVYGGMQSALALAQACDLAVDRHEITAEVRRIRQFTLENGVCDGGLVKHIHPDLDENPYCRSQVDSSLLGVIHPYGLISTDSSLGRVTMNEIRETLLSETGGIYRYAKDTYYGGGTWVLLTAWLGWVEAESGDLDRARTRLDWIADKADTRGWLPEQLSDEVLFPEMVEPWIKQWGQIASPLLWSHAMYLILSETLKQYENRELS